MATLGFVVANAAVESGKKTLVYLTSDGAWLAVKGQAEQIRNVGAPYASLKELVDNFVKEGGKIMVCTLSMQRRLITADTLIEGATPASSAALVEWLANSSPHVSY
jgi:predicted peroxiredoxin